MVFMVEIPRVLKQRDSHVPKGSFLSDRTILYDGIHNMSKRHPGSLLETSF